MTNQTQLYWQRGLKRYLARLEMVVNQDSGSHDPEDVAVLSRQFADWLTAVGAEVDTVRPDEAYGPFLTGRWQGGGGGRVLLVGHLDTVYSHGEASQRPFRLIHDRASGCGVIDMKSGCLLALTAVECLLENARPFGQLVLALTPDEEVGSPVSRPLLAALATEADAVLVLEPGRVGGGVVVGRKGVADFTVSAVGQAAHAGVAPEDGHSAVLELCRQAVSLSALNGREEGLQFNVGLFRGGSRPNVVPGEAEMVVDVRAATDDAVRRAHDIFGSLRAVDAGVRLSVRGGFAMPPMETTPQIQALFDLAQRLARSMGDQLTAVSTGGGSDANHLARAGRPVLDGLGPIGGGAHSPGEFLDVTSVVSRGALLSELLAAVGEQGEAVFARP